MLWNSSYKTGVDEIDWQNFGLFEYIEAMMSPEDGKTRLKQIDFFEELVKKYFEREQIIHNECFYFDAYWHSVDHGAYLKTLQEMKLNFEKDGVTLENEIIFRTKALQLHKNHITHHDKPFAYFYHNNVSGENNISFENTLARKSSPDKRRP